MKSSGVVEVEGLDGDDIETVRGILAGAQRVMDCQLMGIEVCGVEPEDSRALNRRYRGKNKMATVLSFSLPSTEPGGMAGQLLLCPPAVRREARRLGIPYRRWLAELAVHGFLHILGHQHNDAPSRELMVSLQKALLNMAGKGKE